MSKWADQGRFEKKKKRDATRALGNPPSRTRLGVLVVKGKAVASAPRAAQGVSLSTLRVAEVVPRGMCGAHVTKRVPVCVRNKRA
jgi:hypothetical protein